MISAGRVLIKPCGEWKADVTYYMLDLVNHNGLIKTLPAEIISFYLLKHYRWQCMCM